jgi:predicted Zn-dependent protease
MADMQNRLQSLSYRQSPDSLAFHLARAKVRAQQGSPRDAVAVAEEQLRDKRYASEAGARYALAAALLRTRELRRAEKEVALLRGLNVAHPMIDLLDARLKAVRGDARGARDVLRAAWARNVSYRPLAYAFVESLQTLAAHKEALERLSELVKDHPRDPRLYGMQAKSFAATGRTLLQHRALAEQYYLMGAIPAAIEQLQIAQRSKDGDFYQMSVIEARLRELRRELGERPKQR